MTVEDLVMRLDNPETVITICTFKKEQIYHGPARGAVELGYGNYHISHVDGSTWYW